MNHEVVKTRKEVLAEQRYELKAKRKTRDGKRSKKRRDKKQGDDEEDEDEDSNDPKAQMKKQVQEFYAKQGYTPQFETRSGRSIEVEYQKQYGMQGAMHLIMRYPIVWIVQFFLNELNLEYDAPDYRDRTPFSIGIDY